MSEKKVCNEVSWRGNRKSPVADASREMPCRWNGPDALGGIEPLWLLNRTVTRSLKRPKSSASLSSYFLHIQGLCSYRDHMYHGHK